ncbi:MAG: recombinase family protein [Lacipirellulaceae bacterium]
MIVALLLSGLAAATTLPGDNGMGPSTGVATYSRFSTAMQDERSIIDQQDKCNECARREGLQVDPRYQFFDKGTSGASPDRAGFDAMMQAARAGEINVLIFESLSRLSRDLMQSLNTLSELVEARQIRVIAIDDNIDTASGTPWKLPALINGFLNEQYLEILRKQVLRGLRGTAKAGFAVGDHCYGYDTVEASDPAVQRTCKNAKPLKEYVINAEQAKWVRKIFHWFAVERKSCRWIVRELNRLKAPKGRHAQSRNWSTTGVMGILKNPKYVGIWVWGKTKTVRDPLTRRKIKVDRESNDEGIIVRQMPHLTIVDVGVFRSAQDRIAHNSDLYAGSRKENGVWKGATPKSSHANPRHLLQGLVQCGDCLQQREEAGEKGQLLHVGGPSSSYMHCKGYRDGVCSCRTTLRRELAEKMILDAISHRILADERWIEFLFQATLACWNKIEQESPARLKTLEDQMKEVDRGISNLLDLYETNPSSDVNERLKKRQSERRDLQLEIRTLKTQKDSRPAAPTKDWLVSKLSELDNLLRDDPTSAAHALRKVIDGRITVFEVRREGRKRHHLRGEFRIKLDNVASAIGYRTESSNDSELSETFKIDFKDPPCTRHIELADQVKEMFDKGVPAKEIQSSLEISKKLYSKAFAYWHTSRNLPVPDGRSLRGRLEKNTKATRLAKEIMALFNQDHLVHEIGKELNIGLAVVREAVVKYHQDRGLPVPDGRARRKEINQKRRDAQNKTGGQG